MSCQQVPTTPAFNPYPRSVQVGEFEVAIGGGIWVAIRARKHKEGVSGNALLVLLLKLQAKNDQRPN